ncbi:MAG: 50S ribosomal protein L22 [Methanosarcinales archaeon Met12]|nr:MAG: 50S ribosomal protein L22 [Methanosarcinales archaeon Met12]
MSRIKYSKDGLPETTAKAMCYEVHISPKHAVEICREIKGMSVSRAKEYMGEVVALKKAVPFRRYKRNVGHKKGLHKWDAGRYPKKAASEILLLIASAEKNAEYKGLDTKRMRIWHIAAKRGRVIKGNMPRAMGRATPKNTETVTIELVLEGVQ